MTLEEGEEIEEQTQIYEETPIVPQSQSQIEPIVAQTHLLNCG